MKEIQFLPKTMEAEMLVDPPEPARKSIPHWFASMPAFKGGKPKVDNNGEGNSTVKMCLPFADSFGMGYIQSTWADMMVSQEDDGGLTISLSSSDPVLMDMRPETSHKIPEDFYQQEFAWHSQWIPKVPKGYSVMYTHPLNREDLPFQTFSGIVDSDGYHYETDANHPFLIKKGFTGLIPKGTPMFQMIPFKRDDWKSNVVAHDSDHYLRATKVRQRFWGGYKEMFWHKKTFN